MMGQKVIVVAVIAIVVVFLYLNATALFSKSPARTFVCPVLSSISQCDAVPGCAWYACANSCRPQGTPTGDVCPAQITFCNSFTSQSTCMLHAQDACAWSECYSSCLTESFHSSLPCLPTPTPVGPGVTDSTFNTYLNGRFGFAVDLPSSWPAGKEANNGDGITVNIDGLGDQILVYASHVPDSFVTPNMQTKSSTVVLDDGRKASLVQYTDFSGKVIYTVFFDQGGDEFTFYASLSQDYFNTNQQIIQAAAKSLRLISGKYFDRN